jgi:Lrp/AsnC family leucine-responsive transcriptional regulator
MAADHEAANDRPHSPLKSIGLALQKLPPRVNVDAVDLEILRLLTVDGRISQRRLAEELGMSAPAIADRIARLTSKGVISGYTALINFDTLGYSTLVHLSITISEGYDRRQLMEDLAAARGVEEVSLVTGGIDLMVKVRVRDYPDLRDLLTNDIWSIQGIQRTETSVTLGKVDVHNPAARILAELAKELQAGPAAD